MTALRDVSTADLLAEVQHRWQDDTGPLHQLAPMLGSIRELHQHVEPRPAEAAPVWSCGRCDSFAARGFDDGQIPEHHRTCQHAGVGAGPLGDAVAAVLALCDQAERRAVALNDYTLAAPTTETIRRAITDAGVAP